MMKLTVCFVVLMAVVTLTPDGASADNEELCNDVMSSLGDCLENGDQDDESVQVACMKEKLKTNNDFVKIQTECTAANPGDDKAQVKCMEDKLSEQCPDILG